MHLSKIAPATAFSLLLFAAALFLLPSSVVAEEAAPYRVPGTTLELVPPPGFTAADRFTGVQHEASGASVMVVTLPAPFSAMLEKLGTREAAAAAMTGQGVEVKEYHRDYGEQKGIYLEGSQSAYGQTFQKIIYMFPMKDGAATGQLVASVPDAAADKLPSIKESVLGVKAGQGEADPLEGLNFTFENKTGLKFTHRMTNAVMYTPSGSVPDDSIFQLASSVGAPTTDDPKQFVLDRVKTLPGGESAEVSEPTEVTIDGMKGYEVRGTLDGKPMYLGIVFEENNYFVAMANGDDASLVDNAAATFRTLKRAK